MAVIAAFPSVFPVKQVYSPESSFTVFFMFKEPFSYIEYFGP